MSKNKTYSYSIKDLALEDRPREKYRTKGPEALSDTDLIAILLRSGNNEETAIMLSQRILQAFDNDLCKLSCCSYKQLMEFKGVGDTKAITLMAAFELGKRKHHRKTKFTSIHNSGDADKAIRFELHDLKHEEFWILLLDHQNRVLNKYKASQGGLTNTSVDMRLIIKEAMIHSATQMIIAHNHPSGSLSPSKQDLHITDKIKRGLKMVDIELLDHLIITYDDYFSLADHGLIE